LGNSGVWAASRAEASAWRAGKSLSRKEILEFGWGSKKLATRSGTQESHHLVFTSRTLLPLIAVLLVVFILAILISPVVDIPKAGLRTQADLLLFFTALIGAFHFCAGCLWDPRSRRSERILAPPSERQATPVLLC